MIRLAISCDVCGEEKKQTNHWFVAYEHSGELRIGGWNSRYCKRAGSHHLCGQTCLHKLVDEFMAKTIAEDREIAAAELMSMELKSQEQASSSPPQSLPAAEPSMPASPVAAQTGFSSPPAYPVYEDEFGSSARLIPTPASTGEVRSMPVSSEPAPAQAAPAEMPKHAAHQWRTAAWERERRRESSR